MPGGSDDEGNAGLVEPAEGVVEVDGDAGGDAGCQSQDPVFSAAAGQEPGIAAADGGLPVDAGEFGDAVGERGAGADEAGEVVAVHPSGADDQVAGCFEGVEPASAARTASQGRACGAEWWSWLVLLLGGGCRGWQPADACGQLYFLAQPGDLVVLGGEPCQGLVPERRIR